ncbi:MAG: translation initiation factor IF-3 [Deltaproteobacteria bacterium]|nr:translation initiation factor IF-3 [Deltaproteobacteria bacterium]MBW2393485.1 translation initiation factor IF-3 [Deltaproteobacteria bacterium]
MLIGADGEQLGVFMAEDALVKAEEAGYDLVEVAPNARPPVCRIMDYGKYKYEQKKKAAVAKAKGKGRAASLKEVKMRPNTDDHDLDFKLKNARRFLIDGDKVKITVMFRGREMAHRKVGFAKLDKVQELLGELVTVENPPQMNGRFLSMVLVPNREAVDAARKELEAADVRAKEEDAQETQQETAAESAGTEAPAETTETPEAESPAEVTKAPETQAPAGEA